MSEASPSKRRIGGWKLIGMLAGALVLVLGGGGWWWYLSDGDLREFEQRAHAADVPLTWVGSGMVVADAKRLALWQELAALVDDRKLASHQASVKVPAHKPFITSLVDTRAHHAAFDQAQLARLIELIDQLGPEPLVLRVERAVNALMPEIGHYRSLARLLQERVLIADDQQVGREARRLIGLCASYHVSSLLSELIRTSIIDLSLGSIAERLAVLRERDPAIADLLVSLDERGAESMLAAIGGELILARTYCRDPRLVDLPEAPLGTGLAMRAGRRDLLDRELEWLLFLRGRPTALAALHRADVLADIPGPRWDPRFLLSRQLMPVLGVFTSQSVRCRLRARLMAAELRGQPWPADDFDPLGNRLRRWELGGRLVGAYSVDRDGVDHGGDAKKDRYFPLYGPREAPKAP